MAIPFVVALAISGVMSEVDATAVAVLVPLDSGLESCGGRAISIPIGISIGIGGASGCWSDWWVVAELSDFIGEGCNRFLVLLVRGLGYIGRDNRWGTSLLLEGVVGIGKDLMVSCHCPDLGLQLLDNAGLIGTGFLACWWLICVEASE